MDPATNTHGHGGVGARRCGGRRRSCDVADVLDDPRLISALESIVTGRRPKLPRCRMQNVLFRLSETPRHIVDAGPKKLRASTARKVLAEFGEWTTTSASGGSDHVSLWLRGAPGPRPEVREGVGGGATRRFSRTPSRRRARRRHAPGRDCLIRVPASQARFSCIPAGYVAALAGRGWQEAPKVESATLVACASPLCWRQPAWTSASGA